MLIYIILASIIVSCSSLIGGLLLLRKKTLSEDAIIHLVSFAAGVILTVAFVDLLPEAVEHAEELGLHTNIFLFTFFGIILFFFLERFLLWFHHHDDTHGEKPTSILILFGDGFHNFIDGIAIAAAFIADPLLGVITSIAIAAHEIPHELADYSVLVHSGMKPMKALFYNFLSSLTALVGALSGYFFLQSISQSLPYMLAFSAGTFIYIACSDLIPDLHTNFKKQKQWRQSLPLIIGIAIAYIVITIAHGIEH